MFLRRGYHRRHQGALELQTYSETMSTIARIFAPPADRSCSSSLNGSDLEQMVHNKIGRHSLEWVEIWNKGILMKSAHVMLALHYCTYMTHENNTQDQKAPENIPLFYASD